MQISLPCIKTALLFTAASALPSSILTRHSFSITHSSSLARQTMTKHSSTSSGSGPFPELCVFDLDACFWDQEMYTLSHIPQQTHVVRGELMGRGEGVVGVMSGRERISLHKGSLLALQAHHDGEYPGMKVCFASSADTPLAEKIGRAALKLLEVVPGTTVWDLVVERDWNGIDVNQIGRQPPLSANKSATHFPILREVTKIRYDKMLFFDDCIWGDHCGQVERACKERDSGRGVVTVRTPYGLRVEEWHAGLGKYAKLFQE
ncbi:hypothetical protein ACHAW6_013613 [Cyclotella cf. meneghiniana]